MPDLAISHALPYIDLMKRIVLPFCSALLIASSAVAEEERGLSLMERGAMLFIEGIMKEMEPAIDELEGFAQDMGPALKMFADEMGPKRAEIVEQVEDWSAYEAPEILPNGDIIIRRKPDHPIEKPVEPGAQIEL